MLFANKTTSKARGLDGHGQFVCSTNTQMFVGQARERERERDDCAKMDRVNLEVSQLASSHLSHVSHDVHVCITFLRVLRTY